MGLMNIYQMMKHYKGGNEFMRWLDRCLGTTFNHGHALVMVVPGTDNVCTAEKFLKAAEAENWIERMGLTPTPEQKFFGVDGLWKHDEYASACHYGWKPGVKAMDAEAYLYVQQELGWERWI